MANQTWRHIDVFSHNCKITGSIARVCNVHTSVVTTLEDYTTGRFVSLLDSGSINAADINAFPNITSVSGSAQTTDIVINAQECMEGPFIAIHLKSDNPTAIYHNGIYNVVDPDA